MNSRSMMIIAFAAASICSWQGSSAQTARRGIAAAAKELSDSMQRQADLDREIELARKKAEIEIEMNRQIQADRITAARQSRPALSEEEKMVAANPQWSKIFRSSAFNSWLVTRTQSYQDACKKTNSAEVATSCIEDFFNAVILQAR